MTPALDHDFFSAQLHTSFAVGGHDGVALALTAVDILPYQGPGRTGFSLLFSGPAQPQLEQMTYTLDCPGTGPLAIFIVPVGRDQAGIQYQAIFN